MSIFFRTLALLCCLALPSLALAANSTVYDVRLGVQGGGTRLVIEANGQGTIRISEADKTNLTMPPFNFMGTIPVLKPVYNVSYINVDGRSGLVSLKFSRPMRLVSKMSLPPSSNRDARRYVFDFLPHNGGGRFENPADAAIIIDPALATTNDNAANVKPIFTPQPEPQQDTQAMRTSAKPMIIVLDAGHGGKDPGAIAGDGTREKDITLATARAVRNELQQRGYTVFLTRDADIFIPLRERVNIARRYKGDLFISIHADSVASGRSSARGASVYTLSNISSDKETAALAARENQADIIGGIDLSHEDKDVANILIDLAMRDTMNQSKKLANTLVANFSDANLEMRTPAHRFAGFAVLKAADIPSILLEIGYLSNPEEARELTSAQHQGRLARGIAAAIDVYAIKHRPRN